MPLSSENKALVERFYPGAQAAAFIGYMSGLQLDQLLEAARQEERAKAQGEVWDQALALSEMNREAIGYLNRAEAAEASLSKSQASFEEAVRVLTEIARLRTELRGDFSMASKQSDIARTFLLKHGETK